MSSFDHTRRARAAGTEIRPGCPAGRITAGAARVAPHTPMGRRSGATSSLANFPAGSRRWGAFLWDGAGALVLAMLAAATMWGGVWALAIVLP
jgi:hypothetical protein